MSHAPFGDPVVGDAETGATGDLIIAARGGCSDSVGRLAERYRRYLLHVAQESLSPTLRAKVGASDIVQETLLHFQEKFERFEGTSEGELLTWLRRILYFRALEVARRYGTTEARNVQRERSIAEMGHSGHAAPIVDLAPTPCTDLVGKEQRAKMKSAIAALPEDSRQVIHLRNVERHSFLEIGGILGCSADAARKRWVRALAHLRSSLNEDEYE